MAWPRAFHSARIVRLRFQGFAGHHLSPMNEITVFDHQSDRRPESAAVSNAGKYLSLVALDFHAVATAVALLATPELVVELFEVNRQAGGQAFDYCDECLAV